MNNIPVALVIGAPRGLGLDVATQLAAAGLTVLIAARSLDDAVSVLRPCPVSTPCPSASMSAIRHRSPRRRAGCTSVLADSRTRQQRGRLYRPERNRVRRRSGRRRRRHAGERVRHVAPDPGTTAPASPQPTPGGGQRQQRGWFARRPGIRTGCLQRRRGHLRDQQDRAERPHHDLCHRLSDTPVLINVVCPGLTATFPGAEQMGARLVEVSARRRLGRHTPRRRTTRRVLPRRQTSRLVTFQKGAP
jgi:hypothetical protein